ncbi:MAG: DUF1858 domain-containing protein [Deltaproteobacteria bacterium]|nr:DUF1858 domain-containing protein [Deltaproteobacteria bacterium]
MSQGPSITASTKVAALLRHYPELEEVLIAMAPPFVKLRNPILRRSVAKVASLRQAAAVGRLPVEDMVNRLRAVVGQEPLVGDEAPAEDPYFTAQPRWYDADRVVDSMDERDLDPDVMPLNPLLRRATKLVGTEVLELVTDYLPAPGVDILRNKGFATWCVMRGDIVHTYIMRAP